MKIKCPVCEGRGVVQQGFYNPYGHGPTTSLTPDTCKTCNGKTIIDDKDADCDCVYEYVISDKGFCKKCEKKFYEKMYKTNF